MIDGKWKKRLATVVSVGMAAALSLGILSACGEPDDKEEEKDTPAAKTDTQLIKNGDFEFYSEMTSDKDDLRAVLNSPTSWSFTSGSPSSDTKSGLINVGDDYWNYFTKSGRAFTSVQDAYEHWNDEAVTVYDRLKFYEDYEKEIDKLSSSSEEKKLFDKYNYSVDYEDVQYLNEELGSKVLLHDDEKQREKGDTGILMIHNRRDSDGVLGTAQSYSSSTTVTLKAGTSAEVSVWVKTAKLYHYYSNSDADKNTEVTKRAGAYIGVTHTVGGTTLDQMQIKNINTQGVEENNGWEKYTVYLRASTYATSTFRIVLGLGQGSSDNRYEAVNGYALFDDLTCKITNNEAYTTAANALATDYKCKIDSKADKKKFDATELSGREYALDLYAAADPSDKDTIVNDIFADDADLIGLTQETSGSNTYTSEKIDSSLNDLTKTESGTTRSYVAKTTVENLRNKKDNGYLTNIVNDDFSVEKFPFSSNDKVIMILSANGAAYTVKSKEITLDAESRLMISFFVKTSKIMNGRTGAGARIIDGENKTPITAFDSTTLTKVDIDDKQKDIYDGWAQCFFFISNDTDAAKTFQIEFTFGPTTIVGTDRYDYGQGYAAFANFETKALSKTELSYASTGDRAKTVSLTSSVADSTVFDQASASYNIKEELAEPANFTGVLAGSKVLEKDGEENKRPDGVYSGLLNSQYADTYQKLSEPWVAALGGTAGDGWWKSIFGDDKNIGAVARQPLVIVNASEKAQPSYGYFSGKTTVSADSYQKISVRVKLSAGATATLYLIDVSDVNKATPLSPDTPKITYWYDDEGNICSGDPSEKDSEILYYLAENGLYTKADATDGVYYANLHNYKEDGGNLVTKEGTTAFYGHDGKYYAYYDEDKNEYKQEVVNLPDNIARYNYSGTLPTSKIQIKGTAENANQWIDASFYVHTGNEEKNFRFELWAGDRTNTTDGLPQGGFVLFDRYSSASTSNYDKLLKEAETELREAGKLDPDDNENLAPEIAHYYTFTFYDSLSYLRYDKTEDTDNLGNPYGSYKQSEQKEKLAALVFEDTKGNLTGSPASSFFLDYTATDVTVEKDDLGNTDTDSGDEEEKTPMSTGDILIIVSSALLAVVLVFVIVAIIVRRVLQKRRKTVKVRSVGAFRKRPAKVADDESDEEE